MTAARATRADVADLNATAAFNVWARFEVVAAAEGRAELRLPWRSDLGQYAGRHLMDQYDRLRGSCNILLLYRLLCMLRNRPRLFLFQMNIL